MTNKSNWGPGNTNWDAAFSPQSGQLTHLPHYSDFAPMEETRLVGATVFQQGHDPVIEDIAPMRKREATMAKDVRASRVRERLKTVSDLIPRTATVHVLPRDDEIRKGLAHPSGNIGFPDQGSVEWPLDGFTQRRLRDGTITLEGRSPVNAAHPHAEAINRALRQRYDTAHPREQAGASPTAPPRARTGAVGASASHRPEPPKPDKPAT